MENLPALPDDHINNLIAQAIDKHVPVEALEKLLAMRRELRLEYAEQQFNIAMAAFQAECPIIKKNAKVTNKGVVVYRYATIDSIVSQVKHLLKEHGFSYSIESQLTTTHATATCIVQHVEGHSISRSFPVPLGTGTAMMSASQAAAGDMQFATRYAFRNAFGITTGEDDTDTIRANTAPAAPILITHDQMEEIQCLCVTAKLDVHFILRQYKVTDIKALTQRQGDHIIQQCKDYIERMKRVEQGGDDDKL